MSDATTVARSHLSVNRTALAAKAYEIAGECGRVASQVSSVSDRLPPDDVVGLAGEISFMHSRMILLGGYLTGCIAVDDVEIDLALEEQYMATSRSLLASVQNSLEPYNEQR